jgi:dGTPase
MEYWNNYSEMVLKSIYRYLCQLFEKNHADFNAYATSKTALDRKFGNYIKALQEIYAVNDFDRDTILTDYIAGMTDSYALHCFENILTTGTTGL